MLSIIKNLPKINYSAVLNNWNEIMKEIKIQLSKRSRSVIKKNLKLKRIDEVVDHKYADFSPENDICREKVNTIYAKRIRGSVRLRAGRYYTAKEYKDRVKRVKALTLP